MVALGALLMLVVGGASGWVWWDWRAEQRAVEGVRGMRGTVTLRPTGSEALRRRWPVRWLYLLDRADQVFLAGDGTTDAAAIDWAHFRYLRKVTLFRCRVGDQAANRLVELGQIQDVRLLYSTLDRSVISRFAEMPALTELALTTSNVTDADMMTVGQLRRLRGLWLSGTNVGDAGLAHLSGLTRLEALSLRETCVTDAGLAHLHGLTALRTLDVGPTRDQAITFAGLMRLQAALPNVKLTRLRR